MKTRLNMIAMLHQLEAAKAALEDAEVSSPDEIISMRLSDICVRIDTMLGFLREYDALIEMQRRDALANKLAGDHE